ncbi:MAG: VOC family protein [Pseudomonadota bacterium]
MKLYAARIFVDDLAAARAFYEGVLGLTVLWEQEGAALGLAVGAAMLIVEPEDRDGPEGALVGRFLGLSLAIADIAAEHARLSDAGVAFEGPPERQPWGGTLAHLRDPAGNVLTLVQER